MLLRVLLRNCLYDSIHSRGLGDATRCLFGGPVGIVAILLGLILPYSFWAWRMFNCGPIAVVVFVWRKFKKEEKEEVETQGGGMPHAQIVGESGGSDAGAGSVKYADTGQEHNASDDSENPDAEV